MRTLTNKGRWEFPQGLAVYAVQPETTYVVQTNGRMLVVDPNVDALLELERVLRQERAGRVDVLLTHPHPDHFDGALTIQGRYGGQILAHQSLINLQREIEPLSANELMDRFPSPLPLYGDFLCRWCSAYQKLSLTTLEEEIPDWTLRVIRNDTIRYHSPCDCIVYGNGFAFTGDLVFIRNNQFGFGRTDLPGSNEENLTDGLGELIDCLIKPCGLNSCSLLFPGHGQPFTFAELLSAMTRWIEEVPCGDD